MPIISIIMLTYNREELLSRAIECVQAQSLKEFEFIIVDNGSTDRSGAIADGYAERDPRIHVIHRQCGNIGSGRNAGLDAATGEYVTFIDDDDFLETDYLEFLYKLAIKSNAEVSVCGANKEVPIGDKEKKTILMAKYVFDVRLSFSGEEAVEAMLTRKYFNTAFPTKFVKRHIFDNLRFPETGKYDDIALMYIVLARANKVAYHGLPKYTFLRHNENNSSFTTNPSKLTPDTLLEYLEQYRVRTTWLSEQFPKKAETWKYYELSFMISMLEKINRHNLTDCFTIAEYLRKELSVRKNEFLYCNQIQDFEKEWMEKYIQ